ncbi:ilp is an apoptosis inhibitor [Hirsutella rhossiliensis]|uniref:Ilp is an apoptosis inhibitor n=1 Tax=Hirsutella rhossiliensis TaxID=111463 RepID=A0A9P8N2P7_9HYPO|nr:ilp is an apoptosis inhibitor [Hirsutella rhossiliensis]KAH0964856.1 ilp is an apoptosis inhibitor [Hirsutella rhossiliensis]
MSGSFQHPFQESQFDIFEWYPKYQSCLSFFVHHAQHNGPVQAVAAFVNIKLPCQKLPTPPTTPLERPGSAAANASVALVPYVRRLVATGFDTPAVLHGFFGEDWSEGVGTIHETERRNYLFAAKSDTWLRVKANYDMEDGQSVPFLRPLQRVTEVEIVNAESNWSEWLAMQDWMLGPRAPPGISDSRAPRARRD